MQDQATQARGVVALALCMLFTMALGASAEGQILAEDFNTVNGTGSNNALIGPGYGALNGWDNGITGEWAYAGTWGDGWISSSRAQGQRFGGIDGTGAGSLTVAASFFNGGWYAGLFWPDVVLPTLDPTKLRIRADVKVSVPGAAYQLRIEADKYVPYGLDEGFSTVTGIGGEGPFLGPGGIEGWHPNWDTGIDGEAAFAGVSGDRAEVWGGVTARGIMGGGMGGGPAGQLIVDAVSYGSGSSWYAGLLWMNQVLPTTDLTQVYLTANIKGTANGSLGEELGDYMLRIEDSGQDWLAFHMSANRSFQSVGGPLSSGIPGGWGDGMFDPNAGPFSVVVVFDNDTAHTWGFGGRLTVDDLFLTGGEERQVVGSVAISGKSNGEPGFHSLGGVVSDGMSTFVNVDEDFKAATGTGGGTFFDAPSGPNGWTPGWDDGLEREAAFAGYWGSVTVNGGAAARAITSGGYGGGPAGELEVWDIVVDGTGGWWAGLMWQEQTLPDLPLHQIVLRAKVKGVRGSDPGDTLGKFHVRVEDADGDHRGFVVQATGGWQSISGTLLQATEGTFIGDGTFHTDHSPHTVVVAFYEEWDTWGYC